MEEFKDNCYKGTRIVLGGNKRTFLHFTTSVLEQWGYQEISLPIIQPADVFTSKVGEENKKMMYTFKDAGNRDICLAPEYTAVIQQLALNRYKHHKDVKLFYVQECFRGEKPQAGRYRQFTQLGVEILNPSKDYTNELIDIAQQFCYYAAQSVEAKSLFDTNMSVPRGLALYSDRVGFEISCELLGAQRQVCGGGMYQGGIGFALGVDRLMLVNQLVRDAQKEENNNATS